MSDSVRPHRWQPTRLLHPWDSPGKNTGVGCHFLLQCMKVKSESEVTQPCLTLCDPIDGSLPGSSIPVILQARILEQVATAFSVNYYKSIQSSQKFCCRMIHMYHLWKSANTTLYSSPTKNFMYLHKTYFQLHEPSAETQALYLV